jgi:hypothetical protein
MLSPDERIRRAAKADGEELWELLRDPHPEVITQAVHNKNFSVDMALFIAGQRDLNFEILAFLARDTRFRESYKLKLAICRNPKTPQKVVLSLMKFLRVFDLADLAKDQQININIRRKIEYMLAERMSSMPSGVKKALARKANGNILALLIESGDESVVAACLDSPFLTEGLLYKLLPRPSVKPSFIKMTAEHGKWSSRYYIRFGLIRNFYTPMKYVSQFIKAMKTADLRDLYSDPKLPSATRPFIHKELYDRGKAVQDEKERTFILSENEDSDMQNLENRLNE